MQAFETKLLSVEKIRQKDRFSCFQVPKSRKAFILKSLFTGTSGYNAFERDRQEPVEGIVLGNEARSHQNLLVSLYSAPFVCILDCLCRCKAEVKRLIKNVNAINWDIERHITFSTEEISDLIALLVSCLN